MSTLVTPEFRASYLKVFKAEAFEGESEDKAKYSVSMIFDKKADLTGLKKLAVEACDAKWPKKNMAKKIMKEQSDHNPFRNGDDKDDDNYAGKTYINAKASIDRKPVVVGPDVQPLLDASEFVSGDYARAQVTCYAYEFAGNKGVAFGLLKIQRTRDGEPLGNTGGKVEDVFDAVDDDGDSSDTDLF